MTLCMITANGWRCSSASPGTPIRKGARSHRRGPLISLERPDAPALLRTVVRALLVGVTVLYLIGFLDHPGEFSPLVDGVFDNVVTGTAAAVCLGRAVLVRERRLPFTLFGWRCWR